MRMRKHIKNHGPNHAQPSIGVRTRAKTTALKRSSLFMSGPAVVEDKTTKKGGDECYLQLRSRRLERFVAPRTMKARKRKSSPGKKDVGMQKGKVGIKFEKKLSEDENISSDPKIEGNAAKKEKLERNGKDKEDEKEDEKDDYDEIEQGSFGDNEELNLQNKERKARATTPNSLISGSNIPETPASSSSWANTEEKKVVFQGIPSAQEIEEFLAKFEKEQIERFTKKYNFDFMNEKPLEGRYEWVKMEP